MRRLEDPAELGAHLGENAAAWREILDGLDASALEVFGRVEAVSLAWAALQREALAPFGVNYAELATLGMLRTSGPEARCSLSKLRRLVGQSSAGMTRILAKLERCGWVSRENGGGDRRRVDVRLSAAGAALAESALRALLVEQAAILARTGAEERRSLRAGLDALLAAFSRRGA